MTPIVAHCSLVTRVSAVRLVSRQMSRQVPSSRFRAVASPTYRALELFFNIGHPYTDKIDVWSVGFILAEMLAVMQTNKPSDQ